MMDEEIRQALSEVREMKQMCGNINMKLTNIVTQRGQDWKKKLEAEYQRGFEEGKAVNDKGCEGCKYEGRDLNKLPCMVCSKSRENCWTAKQTDNCIEIGDEVEWDGDKYIVTYRNMDINTGVIQDYDLMMWDGSVVDHVKKCSFVKTGNHYDISSILKEMQS